MRTRYGQGLPDRGFTVIEMMITLVVAAILIAVVVPSFTDMISKSRMRSELYSLRSMLMEARSDAMTERQNVSVCPSSDGTSCTGNWNQGYIAFFDVDKDGTVDSGERIMQTRSGGSSSVTVNFKNTSTNTSDNTLTYLLFNSRGNAQVVGKNYNGTIRFCDKRGVKNAAALNVSIVGNVTAATDTDTTADSIVNDEGGTNIACP